MTCLENDYYCNYSDCGDRNRVSCGVLDSETGIQLNICSFCVHPFNPTPFH
jgi:hypothetical protein